MFLKLRGLPPDIEVAEIRSYIQARCLIESILLGELEADAGGTRRVTVATMCDADAATLRRVLTGERLGLYTLLLEAHQPAAAAIISLQENCGPSGYNGRDTDDHGGYSRKVTGVLSGTSNVNFSGLEGLGGSCGIGGNSLDGLGQNRKMRRIRSRGLRGKNEGGGLADFGGTNGRDSGDLGGLGVNNGRNSGGLGGLKDDNWREGDGLSGLGGNSGRYGGGLGGLGGNNGRDNGGLGGFGGNNGRNGGDLSGLSGNDGRYGRGQGSLGENNGGDNVGLGGLGRNNGRDYGGLGGLEGNNGSDGGGLSDLGGNNGRYGGGLSGLRENHWSDGSGLGGLRGKNRRDGGDLSRRGNNERYRGGLGGLGENNGSNSCGLGGLGGNIKRDIGGLGSLGGNNGYSGRNHGGLGGFEGQSGQLYGRGSGGLGKRTRCDDNPVGGSSKRMRYTSEMDGVFASENSSQGRGGYSGPDSSYGSNANSSQDGCAFGEYNEMNSFSGSSGLGGLNAVREHSPHTCDKGKESGKVPPWERTEASQQSDSARARGQARLARRPADRVLPGRQRPRGRSSPLFSGAQCLTGNQQSEQPLMGLGDSQTSFLINPLHQFGLGLDQMQSQFNQPAGMILQCSQENKHIKKRKNKTISSKKNKKKKNVCTTEVQTTSPIPLQTIAPKQKKTKKTAKKVQPPKNNPYIIKKKNLIFINASSNIFNNMVDLNIIEPKYSSIVKSFGSKMRLLVGKRLRELTSEPFGKDLVAIYRNTYPASTDVETLKSVSEQLSLPEIPVPLKIPKIRLTSLELNHKTDDNPAVDLANYVNCNIKVDPESKKTIEETVRTDFFRFTAVRLIATLLLKPDFVVFHTKVSTEEKRLRNYLMDVISTELTKFPQEELLATQDMYEIFRLYHENTSPARNRQILDLAIENWNSKEMFLYKGIYTNPEQTSMMMKFWPDIYLKPGEGQLTPGIIPKSQKKILKSFWKEYASIVLASEVFKHHKAEYKKHKAELTIDDVQDRVRLWLKDRLMDEMPTATSEIVSTYSLVELYRRTYPQETDAELVQGVIKQLLDEILIREKDGTFHKTESMFKMIAMATVVLSQQTVYRRLITSEEEKELTEPQRALLARLKFLIRNRINRLLKVEGARVRNVEQLLAAYRKQFPSSMDHAFVVNIAGKLDKYLKARSFAQQQKEQNDCEPEESNMDSAAQEPVKVSSTKLRIWRESCAWQVADEVLHGQLMDNKERNVLSLDALTKLRLVRGMVREQLEEIIAGKHGAVSMRNDVYQIYRKLHPLADDAALKAIVMCKAHPLNVDKLKEAAKEVAVTKMTAWCDLVMCQVADEVLFGEVLSGQQRKALSLDAQEQIRLARVMVRKQLEELLAEEPKRVSTCQDLHQLYRKLHPPAEYAALKARVMSKAYELKAAAKSNAVNYQIPNSGVDLPVGSDFSADITLDNLGQDDNKSVCQQNGNYVKPKDGASGDTSERIDFTDEDKATNIADNIDFSSYDIEINADDLEDY